MRTPIVNDDSGKVWAVNNSRKAIIHMMHQQCNLIPEWHGKDNTKMSTEISETSACEEVCWACVWAPLCDRTKAVPSFGQTIQGGMLQLQAGGIQQCMSWRELPAVIEDQQVVRRATRRTKSLSGASNIKTCDGAGWGECRYCIGWERYCKDWIITMLKGKSISFTCQQLFRAVKPSTTEP